MRSRHPRSVPSDSRSIFLWGGPDFFWREKAMCWGASELPEEYGEGTMAHNLSVRDDDNCLIPYLL
jgi:hypothetical protein